MMNICIVSTESRDREGRKKKSFTSRSWLLFAVGGALALGRMPGIHVRMWKLQQWILKIMREVIKMSAILIVK